LSYRVFYFERQPDGEWNEPAAYPQQAVAVVTTHDLPTLAGFWTGEDIRLRGRLGFYRDPAAQDHAVIEREADKARIIAALRKVGLLPPGASDAEVMKRMTPALCEAIH